MASRSYLCLLLLLPVLPSTTVSAKGIPYLRCFEIASERHDVPLDLLVGVARVESNFDPNARSSANAHGIMQVQWPGTARHLGVRRVSELYNPCLNIDLGATYLKELLHRYGDNHRLTLAAYNYGPTRLTREDDIPRGVNAYVNRVLESDQCGNQVRVTGKIELNQFKSHRTAERYVATVARLIPGASIELKRERGPVYTVTLDRTQLSPVDQFRLSRLFPAID